VTALGYWENIKPKLMLLDRRGPYRLVNIIKIKSPLGKAPTLIDTGEIIKERKCEKPPLVLLKHNATNINGSGLILSKFLSK
jgi:hypothetical protein